MPIVPDAPYSTPVRLIKLAEQREFSPYVWVHPD
jgi:hypothetical protein